MEARDTGTLNNLAKSHGSSEDMTNPVMHGAAKVAMDGEKVNTRLNSLATNISLDKTQKK